MKWFDNTALTVVIIGAVNWLLIGIFRLDLIAWLFGNMSWLSRIVYTIVGLCGFYLISLIGRMIYVRILIRPGNVPDTISVYFSTCLKKKGTPDKRCPFLCIR